MRALEPAVGALPESFRVLRIDHFPAEGNHDRSKKQAPAEKVFDKQHRRKHHDVAPVIDPAVDTAFILHNKCLEGAEYNDADVIAEEIENCQHQQIAIPDHAQQIKHAEYSIEGQPDQHHDPGADIHAPYEAKKFQLRITADLLIGFFLLLQDRH